MNHFHALVVLAASALSSFTASAQSTELMAPVAWLAGCWSADGREPGSVEHWLPPAGGTMLGVSRTVKGGKTVETEFMQMRSNSDGQLVYIALPSGQKETTFVLIKATENEVIFENAKHDFPQRIIYRRLPEKRMIARIEGMRSGVLRGMDFPMSRIPCGPLGLETGK